MTQQTPAPVPAEPSLDYTFRRVAGLGVDFLGARSLDAMDAWEVDPPGWEPQWYRHMGQECRNIYVCPGCEAWQVEYSAHGYALVSLDDPHAELAPFAAPTWQMSTGSSVQFLMCSPGSPEWRVVTGAPAPDSATTQTA